MQVQDFWVVMLSSKITYFHHLEEVYCRHLQLAKGNYKKNSSSLECKGDMFLEISRSSPSVAQDNSPEYLNLQNIYFWHLLNYIVI